MSHTGPAWGAPMEYQLCFGCSGLLWGLGPKTSTERSLEEASRLLFPRLLGLLGFSRSFSSKEIVLIGECVREILKEVKC